VSLHSRKAPRPSLVVGIIIPQAIATWGSGAVFIPPFLRLGIGTLIALMLPFRIVIIIIWTLLRRLVPAWHPVQDRHLNLPALTSGGVRQ
jgi:p-aminobenzoyl-glutamate transporter AbgT